MCIVWIMWDVILLSNYDSILLLNMVAGWYQIYASVIINQNLNKIEEKKSGKMLPKPAVWKRRETEKKSYACLWFLYKDFSRQQYKGGAPWFTLVEGTEFRVGEPEAAVVWWRSIDKKERHPEVYKGLPWVFGIMLNFMCRVRIYETIKQKTSVQS